MRAPAPERQADAERHPAPGLGALRRLHRAGHVFGLKLGRDLRRVDDGDHAEGHTAEEGREDGGDEVGADPRYCHRLRRRALRGRQHGGCNPRCRWCRRGSGWRGLWRLFEGGAADDAAAGIVVVLGSTLAAEHDFASRARTGALGVRRIVGKAGIGAKAGEARRHATGRNRPARRRCTSRRLCRCRRCRWC
jgi:hypothetical protein